MTAVTTVVVQSLGPHVAALLVVEELAAVVDEVQSAQVPDGVVLVVADLVELAVVVGVVHVIPAEAVAARAAMTVATFIFNMMDLIS